MYGETECHERREMDRQLVGEIVPDSLPGWFDCGDMPSMAGMTLKERAELYRASKREQAQIEPAEAEDFLRWHSDVF